MDGQKETHEDLNIWVTNKFNEHMENFYTLKVKNHFKLFISCS
jgi:hypothetical protein